MINDHTPKIWAIIVSGTLAAWIVAAGLLAMVLA